MSDAHAQSTVPIVEVAFASGTWWAMPQQLSARLYQEFESGRTAMPYVWESARPNGERSSISQYVIDFAAGVQTNLDNQYQRAVRVVWVRPQDVEPQFTGQLPQDS